jgi:Ca2+-binding EF-hand superfamily protein
LHELDPKLTETELDGIIEEIDEDGSGTVDFDGENRGPML